MSIELKIKEIIAELLDVEIEDAAADAYLADDLGSDPYDLESLAVTLNEEFDIRLSEDDIDSWETVSDIIAAVQDKME